MSDRSKAGGILRIVAAGMVLAVVLFGFTDPRQAGAAAGQSSVPLAFEVASIRPSGAAPKGAPMDRMAVSPGGRWTASAMSVSKLIQIAYDVKPFQISGGPVWLEEERFDIVAKAEMPSINPEQLKALLQSLLAERFNLQFHRETRTLPVYALLVGKDGHKLRASVIQPGAEEAQETGIRWVGKTGLDAQKTTVSALLEVLDKFLDRPVIDKTGISGDFDFSLRWAVDESWLKGLKGDNSDGGGGLPSAPAVSPIIGAVQNQLGLRLDPQKSPVEVLVIDRIEKASGN